jgi:DNA-directed RNA polymerase subunit omega
MARITVEDCLETISNRFSLVLVSAERTKQLLRGADQLVENDEDNKEVVQSLREIAAGKFHIDESAVLAHDEHMPTARRAAPATSEALPPEATADAASQDFELPPEI